MKTVFSNRQLLVLLWMLLPGVIFGQSPPTTSIIGGTQIDITQAPYQVSIEDAADGSHFCGGVILSDRWILTAAHCVSNVTSVIIHAGSTDQTDNNVGQRITSSNIVIHPNYNAMIYGYDLALIELSQPLVFNHQVSPIEYANPCNITISDISDLGPTPGSSSPTPIAFLTGWGLACNFCSTAATHLQGVEIPWISPAQAMAINLNHNPTYTRVVSSLNLAFYDPGKSASNGDSGGPAVINKNGNLINVGITSWGYSPEHLLPSIYVSVYFYKTWIEQVMGYAINSTGTDLYTRDKPWDMGFEPGNAGQALWESESIWIRNQQDGIEEHQNPEYYTQGNSNYVYVKIRNRGCTASQGNEVLDVYWAKASTALAWPSHWNGSLSVAGNSLGDLVGQVTLPVIPPGEAHIAVIPWNPPNPANFVGLATGNPLFWADEPHHFCLLTRITGASDPMTTPETSDLWQNINNNNNISLKNVTVVDLNPADFEENITPKGPAKGATVLVGDAWGKGGTYDLVFQNANDYQENDITREAEVIVTLDDKLWDKWKEGGFVNTNLEILNEEKKQVKVIKAPAALKKLHFSANERRLIHTGFKFIADKISSKRQFAFQVLQKNSVNQQVIGGEKFTVKLPIPQIRVGVSQPNTFEERLIAEVTNGSGDYQYQWTTADNSLESTTSSITPCNDQVYTLKVLDLVTNLSSSTQFHFKASNTCKAQKSYSKKSRISNTDFSQFKVFPNPAQDFLDIQVNLNDEIVKIKVLGTQGQVLQTVVGKQQARQRISLNGFAKGFYILEVITDKNSLRQTFLVR
ncbi:MAG TPA: hypothetical protein DCS93_09600 [Microscillaceae bacterium]|nr:hypothetical protein [Microscillaceae bacterium]